MFALSWELVSNLTKIPNMTHWLFFIRLDKYLYYDSMTCIILVLPMYFTENMN
jgi:hypothetical protein